MYEYLNDIMFILLGFWFSFTNIFSLLTAVVIAVIISVVNKKHLYFAVNLIVWGITAVMLFVHRLWAQFIFVKFPFFFNALIFFLCLMCILMVITPLTAYLVSLIRFKLNNWRYFLLYPVFLLLYVVLLIINWGYFTYIP